MHVTLLNLMDAQGGAARSAYRLMLGLQAIGQPVKYFVGQQSVPNPDIVTYQPDGSPQALLNRHNKIQESQKAFDVYAATRDPNMEIFTYPSTDGDLSFFDQLPKADVYNPHWIAGFLDYPLFFNPERTTTPVVWTLHDQGPFTGGCHYDELCGRFTDACGACPLLGSDDPNDLSAKNFQIKKDALAQWPDHMMHIVSPSRWLAEEARKSALFGRFDVSCIPYGIETDVFRPYDQATCREEIGLPQDAKIILFVANHLKLRRKGFQNLMNALSLYPNPEELMLLGVGASHEEELSMPFRLAQADYVDNDSTMAKLYSAADVTAIPSFQDNLPNTMLESMACGTPVVAFDVGGIPDLVKDGETGFLARSEKVVDLGTAFVTALSDLTRLKEMGEIGRQKMEAEHKLADQATAYIPLYEQMVSQARGAGS